MAVTAKTTASELRAQVKQLTDDGRHGSAYRLLAERAQSGPAFHEYPWLARELAAMQGDGIPEATPFRLAFLNTYTLEPIRESLRAQGLAARFDIDAYFGGYGQLEQEVLDPGSGMARHRPHAVVLAWLLEDVAPALASAPLTLGPEQIDAEIDAVIERATRIVAGATETVAGAQVLMHSFVAPEHPALGILDTAADGGHTAIVSRLNDGLRALAAENPAVHVLDCGRLARLAGERWRSPRHWFSSRALHAPEALALLAAEYVKFVRAIAGKAKKVLVTDLDNTFWGGILGEDGVDGIAIGDSYPGNAYLAYHRELATLAARGVVLAINSKNNESDVREAFERRDEIALDWDAFASKRINWTDKATNLREIAAELSLGLDSFVFIDDSPYELEMVASELPEVTTVMAPKEPAELPGLLSRAGYFDTLIYSAEDRKRTDLYRSQARRAELQRGAPDLESFYRSLAMTLTAETVDAASVARVAQLTQRTNQFNMTTRRYTEADVERMRADPDFALHAYRLTDRFGDNGVISVAISRKSAKEWEIDTLLMSCRVIGRTVETAILALLARDAERAGAEALLGRFAPTRKNEPASDVYERHGFIRTAQHDDGSVWRLALPASIAVPDWIETVERPG